MTVVLVTVGTTTSGTIKKLATTKVAPSKSPGLDFHNTGVTLITDKPVAGVSSVTSAQGAKTCWGTIG